jgi:hypothetical protein
MRAWWTVAANWVAEVKFWLIKPMAPLTTSPISSTLHFIVWHAIATAVECDAELNAVGAGWNEWAAVALTPGSSRQTVKRRAL